MPRKVARRRLKEMLHWTTSGLSPRSSNSRRQKLRAKNPRSSSISSGSMMKAPASLVSINRIGLHPRESNAGGFDDSRPRNRNNELPAAAQEWVLLPHYLLGDVPRQNQRVIRALTQQSFRRINWNARPGQQ